jgi:hypothetical protein
MRCGSRPAAMIEFEALPTMGLEKPLTQANSKAKLNL